MTEARPTRPELRHTVLAKLSAHTAEVEWKATGAHLAYADTVIDFADWLATTTPPPPALRGPSSTPAGRAAARDHGDPPRPRGGVVTGRCKCHGLKSQHGKNHRGRPTCFHSMVCACTEYREDVQASMRRHPAGKATPARFDERYDPSPDPIDRSIQ